jgi:hypothetical protein
MKAALGHCNQRDSQGKRIPKETLRNSERVATVCDSTTLDATLSGLRKSVADDEDPGLQQPWAEIGHAFSVKGDGNEQVQRNRKRFPNDFMFRITKPEAEALRSEFVISNASQGGFRSQVATSKTGRSGRRYLP